MLKTRYQSRQCQNLSTVQEQLSPGALIILLKVHMGIALSRMLP